MKNPATSDALIVAINKAMVIVTAMLLKCTEYMNTVRNVPSNRARKTTR